MAEWYTDGGVRRISSKATNTSCAPALVDKTRSIEAKTNAHIPADTAQANATTPSESASSFRQTVRTGSFYNLCFQEWVQPVVNASILLAVDVVTDLCVVEASRAKLPRRRLPRWVCC